MFETPWIAALAALFLWWFATGILLWRVHAADRGGPDSHVWSVILSLPLFAVGVLGVNATLTDPSPQGAWFAFLAALAIWGWVELAFLLRGIITGAGNTAGLPGMAGAAAPSVFSGRGSGAPWVLVTKPCVCGLGSGVRWPMRHGARPTRSRSGPSRFLFFARVSAKLNLYMGVPFINTAFLPSPLSHLASYFRPGPVSGFFPASVTLLALGFGCFLERLWRAHQAGDQGDIIGFTLLSMLAALALLEHWFMVWRVQDDKTLALDDSSPGK